MIDDLVTITRPIDRRAFMERLAMAAGAAALAGCASLVTHQVTPVGNVIRLSPTQFPELGAPAGVVRVQPAGMTDPLYVLRLKADTPAYAAVSPKCTHRGCTVDVQGETLVCPCHGSTFARTGAVLRGPAERPLPEYRTTIAADGAVEVHL